MNRLLPELFLARAREHPDAPAVVAGTDGLSYGALERSARRVAGALAGLGAGPESVVAVLMAPGPQLVEALLGVWLAGACYLPLDPFAPPGRLRRVVEAAGAHLTVVDRTWSGRGAELAPSTAAHLVDDLLDAGDPDTPPLPATGHRAAYVIFTSGSTGAPKGVVVDHAGIANRVCWGVRALGLGADDRVLQKTPLTFDAAGWEIFGPLVCGAPVTFGRPDAGRDPAELVASIREQRATVVQVVPTMLRLLAAEPGLDSCTTLRTVCSAGEPLHAELCRRVLDRVDVEIWNTYGPTECSIDALAQRFDRAQLTGAVPIGEPIDNARVLLLPPGDGENGGDAPAGDTAAGDGDPLYELYLCGPGVARGYHGDPARTATRFLPDPAGPPGARMFRTGDLVRRRPDGALEFAGRIDDQLKVNGVRIEPGEVEAALETHPEVVEAAVRAVDGPDGTRRLVAWVVTSRTGAAEDLVAHLRDRLPPALVPALVTETDAFPRTTSGKTDRARLPEPDWSSAPGPAAPAPQTAEERIVLAAWRQLLDTDGIGPDDDFFRLGGHSLMLTRLAAGLTRASGLDVPLRDLHYASTVRQQAELLSRASAAQPIEALPPGARLPLTHAQERFWVLDRMSPRSREYLLPILLWLPAEVPADLVEDALARLVERHEVLRTRYVMDGRGLAAVVEPADAAPVKLRTVETTPDRVDGLVAEQLGEGFDLASAPLLRAALLRDGGPEQLLLLVCHHIVGDGWSSRLLEQELRATVSALGEGREPVLPEPALRYVDAAAWLRAQLTDDLLEEQLAYWRETLADLPALELPTARERADRRGIDGTGVVVDLPAPSVEALLALGRRTGATPYVVFLTLWTVALARAAGQWDFGTGSPHAGRIRPELHDLVGLFLNTVVLRPRLTPDLPFEEAVAVVEQTCRESFARHAAPFEAVAEAVAPARDLSRTPLFQNLFALTGDDGIGQVPRERDLELLGRAWTVSRTDLALTLWPYPDGSYGGALEYSSALYDEAVATGLAGRLRDLAERFAADPALTVGAAGLDEPEVTEVPELTETAEVPDVAEADGTAADGTAAAGLETILGFVRELLELPDAGPDDDFMTHGGNSLLAARLLWNIQTAFGVEVSMRAFFDRPTATDLAREVEELLRESDGTPDRQGDSTGKDT
ncbi:amino acid adenylation domain-containing protein [Streptomyces sp. BE20]|uniref:amino acid adenylation domain-containing protein n=1 Tax=Streptomyces sp. BE20 TaxID=3002525 RepID=UPI002E78D87A|nr:amino acid adenylation domain-containing protein [Streptomyces sp. BE20]MEE1827988.1 amino acid adenylation domain-containing protein [Streptomyces sp. BE20]